MGNVVFESNFETFREFTKRFPVSEISIPVRIMSPDDGGVNYWLITLSTPTTGEMRDCCIRMATTHDIVKYRKQVLKQFKLAIGIDIQ